MPTNETTDFPRARSRRIRSFVLRAGRLTAGQKKALDEYGHKFCIARRKDELDLAECFGRQAPVTLEIGFGTGDNLVDMAAAAPERDFIGIEVHRPGVGHCLLRTVGEGLTNVRLIEDDAVEVLQQSIPDGSLARVNLFFPDPWHKKRHHKRRIVQVEFVELVARKLQPEGLFHVVTDWPGYAEHIAAVMADCPVFEPLREPPADRPVSRFDTRGQRLGHNNWERAWCNRSKLPISG